MTRKELIRCKTNQPTNQPIAVGALIMVSSYIEKETQGIEDQKNWNHLNHSIKIS